MNVARKIAAAVLALSLAAGCAREPAETDADTPVQAKPGETVELFLRANPSTGYAWRIAEAPDTGIVAPAGNSYRPRPGTANRNGAGGTDRWSFVARKPGRTQVTLVYARPWEKDVAPVETRRFSFVVE